MNNAKPSRNKWKISASIRLRRSAKDIAKHIPTVGMANKKCAREGSCCKKIDKEVTAKNQIRTVIIFWASMPLRPPKPLLLNITTMKNSNRKPHLINVTKCRSGAK